MSTPTNTNPTNTASDSGTSTKNKKPRTVGQIVLVAVTKDHKTGLRTWTELPLPDAIKDPKNKHTRMKSAYKPAVRAMLEAGKLADAYSNKDIGPIEVYETFKFTAEIQKVEVTKVNIKEG